MVGKRFNWLGGEVASWQHDGVISEEQARAIMARYRDPAGSDEAERGGRLVTTLAALGSILLGVGVVLFLAANWPAIPRWLKVVAVLGSILAAYASGYWLAFEKMTYPRVGRALIFLGSVLFGAGIWLIAQVFHIRAHYPNGILFWALGIIPVAVVARSVPILTEASLLLILWTIFEQSQSGTANLLYLPLSALVLILSHTLKSGLTAGISLAGLAIWVAMASFGLRLSPAFTLLLTAIMGMLFFSVGSRPGYGGLRAPYRIVGQGVFFLSLYLLTFAPLARVLGDRPLTGSIFLAAAFAIVGGCALGAGFLALSGARRDERRARKHYWEGSLVIAVCALLITLALLGPVAGGKFFLVAANTMLFLAVVAFVAGGYQNREPDMVNFGVAFFVLGIVARYFDFFWDMLDKSVFFMAGGLLLLAGGFLLERNRQKLIREMRAGI